MPIYSCQVVGTGTELDPIRAPFFGTDRRIGSIILAPQNSTVGPCLLYLPDPSSDPRLRKIADAPTERTTQGVRNVLQNELGITLSSASTASFAELIAEVMKDHGNTTGTRWGILQPSKLRQRYEIHLGALGAIWTQPVAPMPATQTFTESWPSAGAITSGQDNTWANVLNTMEVASGVVKTATGTISIGRCDSVLDTANQYHQATFALVDGVTSVNSVAVYVRFSDNSNWYRTIATRRSTTGHVRGTTAKRVVGADTTLITGDTADPGASGTIKVTVDGSTVSVICGGFTDSATDGSPALLTNVKGAILCQTVTSVLTDATLDDHTIADVVSAAVTAAPQRLMVLGVS